MKERDFRMPMPGGGGQGARSKDQAPDPNFRTLNLDPCSLLPPPKEPFPRVVDVREVPCTVCSKSCRYESVNHPLAESPAPGAPVTSPHPEAPEFLRSGRCWIGFVLDSQDEGSLSYAGVPGAGPSATGWFIIACSEECVQRLLRE